MGKLKTYKGASKRLKKTKSNQLLFSATNWNHLKAKKPARIKHKKGVARKIHEHVLKKVKLLMPGTSTR